MFIDGFEKTALSIRAKELALLGGAAATIGGLGALQGHQIHVLKKLIHARQGKEYKPKSFIDKHPKLTGAATLGIAPAVSASLHQMRLDRENKKVRKVHSEHPVVLGSIG